MSNAIYISEHLLQSVRSEIQLLTHPASQLVKCRQCLSRSNTWRKKLMLLFVLEQYCTSVNSPQTAINLPSPSKIKSKSKSEFKLSGATAGITQLLSVICLGNTEFNRRLKIFQAHCTGAEDLSCLEMFALLNYFFCSNH